MSTIRHLFFEFKAPTIFNTLLNGFNELRIVPLAIQFTRSWFYRCCAELHFLRDKPMNGASGIPSPHCACTYLKNNRKMRKAAVKWDAQLLRNYLFGVDVFINENLSAILNEPLSILSLLFIVESILTVPRLRLFLCFHSTRHDQMILCTDFNWTHIRFAQISIGTTVPCDVDGENKPLTGNAISVFIQMSKNSTFHTFRSTGSIDLEFWGARDLTSEFHSPRHIG